MPLALPYVIANGQAIDAVPVEANFTTLANALPAAVPAAASGANADITSLSALTTPLSAAQGGTGDNNSAWTAFSGLTVTSQSGTLTTASATGRYKRIGKTVFFNITVTITTNGTGATAIQVAGLPFVTAGAPQQVVVGRETALTGFMLLGYISAGTSTISIQRYDATYPAANGYVLALSGTIEAT